MRHATPTLLAAFLVLAPAHAAGPNMREGMWEVTTKMEMPGKPEVAMPQQTVKHCMTKQDVADPKRATPSAGDPGRCKMADYKLQGNTATWQVACQDGTTGTGTVTYSGDAYSGSQTIAMKRSGQAMNMKMTYSGRRVGDCAAK